jgi:uncharacterized protein YbjT (DUF2867 family)
MKAILVGATGLVGTELLRLLLADREVTQVVVLARRALDATDARLRAHAIDFDAPASWAALVAGDVLFSALGTTLKVAGSQEAQHRVDHGNQLAAARAARANGVETLVLVSATGADAGSRIFYSRMKGEIERDVVALGFPRTRILRPGLLDGPRQEHRAGEKLALGLLRPLGAILPSKLRPIHATTVARAALAAARDRTPGPQRLEADDLFKLGAA